MRHVNVSRGITNTEARDRPVGRGTARLAAFTALGLAAGSLVGAAAMLHFSDADVRIAATTQVPAETKAPPAEQLTAEAGDAVTAPENGTRAVADEGATDAEAADAIMTASAASTPRSAPAVPTAENETTLAEAPSETVAPATRTLVDTQSLAARFGGPAPEAGASQAPEAVPQTAASVAEAAETGEAPDTGALPEDIEIAETEAEVLAIEERLSAAGAAYFELPQEPDDPFEAAISDEVPLPPARTNQWVNMRAGPDNDAEILTVVPFDAEIGAEADCRSWCEVVYEGQRGYIYQSFIRQ